MSIETLKEKAKTYSISQEYLDSKEKGRLEFVTKFPLDRISELSLDQYVLGTDKESFCYWLEFKKIEDKVILFGVGGGNASKFGLYKSNDGSYQIGFGEKKKTLNGKQLEEYFSSIKSTIILALKYVSENRILEIKKMNIPFGNMILQKILSIYYPDKFITIGSSNVLIDLAKYINLQDIDLNSNNLIEINYECKKAIDAIPEFKNWSYEKIGNFVWNYFDGENKKGSRKDNINYYLVGAYWDGSNPADQTTRFVEHGIWENGYDDKFNDEVNAVPVGSKIAIKAAFTREKTKSIMAIKAIGTVIENLKDGQKLIVEWDDNFNPFEVNFSGGYWATIKEVTNKDHINSIFNSNTNGINNFESVKSKFQTSVFSNYINLVRKIILDLKLQRNDQRIVYSVRDNRLNFIVGQRYCFNLYASDIRGVYGVISKVKLTEKSEPYEGNPPQPFYSYFNEFNPNSQEWESIIEAIIEELSRTTKSGYRKYNDEDFEHFVFNSTRQIVDKINYKEQYTNWLNSTNKEGSKKAGSYIRAIEILSEITGKEVFEEDNLTVLNALYQDLLNEQEKADGKYYYEQAPSYGASRFYSASINSYSDFITQLPKTQIARTLLTPNMSLNSILYGPPGTGKTYNTINKAIAIANPTFDLSQNRTEVKKEFDRLMKEGQIVFTTFHQSMNYEDFIEGIKPIEPEKEGDPISYQIEYGIFRNLCIEASFSIAQLREDKTTEEVLDFSILYDKFAESVEEKLLNGEQVELETKKGGTVLVESISQQGNFVIKHHDGTRSYTVSKTRLTKLQSAIKNLDDVSNINDQFREVIGGSNSSAYWSVLNAIRKEKRTQPTKEESRTYTFSDKKDVVLSLTKSDYVNKNGKHFVLIIDEINRGNVSQIFGELITLIEDDKRLGKDEALEVTLPYSKEKFGVPPNLFIIGTMNTADRSVEALDSALRRRFNFEEMPPKPELIKQEGKLENGVLENIELVLLLNTINRRIEKLLDKDHQIGHSYFISVSNFTDLKSVFQKKIVPLLQEYFFGDYGKIGLVIGKGFFEPIENDENIFADFDDYDTSSFAERNIYRIKDISKMDERVFVNALITLMNK